MRRNKPVLRTRSKAYIKSRIWGSFFKIMLIIIIPNATMVALALIPGLFCNEGFKYIFLLLTTLFLIITCFKIFFGGFIGKYQIVNYARGEDVVGKISNKTYLIILVIFITIQVLLFVLDRIVYQ